jgi:hypothetical protein
MNKMESFVGGSLAAAKVKITGQLPRCHTNEDTKPSEALQKKKKKPPIHIRLGGVIISY